MSKKYSSGENKLQLESKSLRDSLRKHLRGNQSSLTRVNKLRVDTRDYRRTGLHIFRYVGAPARLNHFSTTDSCGAKHTAMQYFIKLSVKGVFSMCNSEKFGSSLATVAASQLILDFFSCLPLLPPDEADGLSLNLDV